MTILGDRRALAPAFPTAGRPSPWCRTQLNPDPSIQSPALALAASPQPPISPVSPPHAQDRWKHSPPPGHLPVGQPPDPEELCQEQVESKLS